MAVEVKWTVLALEDIENIASFIAKDSKHNAILQVERFFQRVKSFEIQLGKPVPEIGSKSIRELIEGNYRIISARRIDVLTVHHQRRLLSNNPLFE